MAFVGRLRQSLVGFGAVRCVSSLITTTFARATPPCGTVVAGSRVTSLSIRTASLDLMPRDQAIYAVKGLGPETNVLVVDEHSIAQGLMTIEEAIMTQPKDYNLVLVKKNFYNDRLPVVRRFAEESWAGWRAYRRDWKQEAIIRVRSLKKARALKERNVRREKALINKGSRVYQQTKRELAKRKNK